MVQFSSVLFAQIRFLVQNLYKKNAKNKEETDIPGGGVREEKASGPPYLHQSCSRRPNHPFFLAPSSTIDEIVIEEFRRGGHQTV